MLWQAATMEDRADNAHDVIVQLQRENHAMRQLLELELLDSADVPTGTEMQKPPSSDAAIQTHSSPDDDPFCTGDFATIRPRPRSSRTPPSAKSCSDGENAWNSPRAPSQGNEDRCSRVPSSENSPDVSSSRLESSNDACSAADVDCDAADEIGHADSSESLETLVNNSELSADDDDDCL